MTATITFVDGIGAATLSNGKPGPASRFGNWVPSTMPIGDAKVVQGTGATVMFTYRTDYLASFELAHIPVETSGGVRLVDVATRLIAWLHAGGTCAVNTGDVEANSYATCGIAPGTKAKLALTDRKNLEYTLTLSLINLAVSPGPLVCHYRS
jgi:hypothetical protein